MNHVEEANRLLRGAQHVAEGKVKTSRPEPVVISEALAAAQVHAILALVQAVKALDTQS